jgi:hypothetical protein
VVKSFKKGVKGDEDMNKRNMKVFVRVYKTTAEGSKEVGRVVLQSDNSLKVAVAEPENLPLCRAIADDPISVPLNEKERSRMFPTQGLAFLQALHVVYSGSYVRVGKVESD